MSRARVGVVVLTHNRCAEVVETVARMRAQAPRPPLVVVDNASADDTAETIARRFHEVHLVRLDMNRGAAGRNVGVARLETPYVAFCADDTWWEPGMLGRAATLLDAHPRLAVLTGTVLVEPGVGVDPTCLEMAESPRPDVDGLPGRPVLGFLCAATTVRRLAFLDVGGFEPRLFLGGEEHLLAIDLAVRGWALAYVEDIVVHHRPSPRRDADARRRLLLRNALWCAWLRRPASSAARMTARAAGMCGRDRRLLPGLVAAVAGLPWVLGERRVVPPRVERGLRALELAAARRPSAAVAAGAPPA